MISLAAFAVLASAPVVTVVELPDPAAKNVRVSVSISAPFEMMDREQGAWRILPSLVFGGTKNYFRETINGIALEGGRLPLAEGTTDIIRLEMFAAPDSLDSAVSVMESVLTQPRFRDEDVEAARKQLLSRRHDPLQELLDPARPNLDRVTAEICEVLWLQACAPSRLTIVVSGAFAPGDGTKAFEGRFRVPPAPPRGSIRYDQPPSELKTRDQLLSSFELAGPAISLNAEDAGARLVAAHALGAGKGATTFRILREKEGLAYDPRVILWPSAKGWTPRLYLLRRAEENDRAVLERMITAIEADVEAWTEEDLQRARAIASAALDGFPVDNLFWLDQSGPVPSFAEDEAAIRAYLAMAGAPNWTRERLKSEMGKVGLESLKTAGSDFIKTAKTRVIPGLR